MIILASGDSFTAGHELKTSNTWSKLLADSVNANYISVAKSGIGNKQIAVRAINYVCRKKVDFVLVMWTFLSRYDYLFSFDTQETNTPWYTINPHYINSDFATGFHIDHITRARKFKVAEFAEQTYRFLGDQHEIQETLLQILQLQNFLKLKQIPYLFTSADSWFEYNDELKNPLLTKELVNTIDWDKFYWFNYNDKKIGFLDWSKFNKFNYGVCHPLDDAHEQAFLLMKDRFDELVKRDIHTNNI